MAEKMPDHVARTLLRFYMRTAIPRRLAEERTNRKEAANRGKAKQA